jgi:lysozyme
MLVSEHGARYSGGHEGFVSRTYKDPGGVMTIGHGFTNLSPTFKAYWIRTRGHALRMGDTISMAESLKVLRMIMDEEVAPAVNRDIQPKLQHHMDGAADTAYNAGVGSLKWKWGVALRAGRVSEAARLLLTTAITAGGKVLNGLKRRRRETARLIEFGEYGIVGVDSALTIIPSEVKVVQKDLTDLGYYGGDINGNHQDPLYVGAVKNFQRQAGLKVDGKVGRATRSAIQRAKDAKGRGVTAIGAGGGTGGLGLLGFQIDNPWLLVGGAALVVVLVYLAFVIWHNRGAIMRQRTPA